MNTLLEQQDEVSSLRSQEELRQKYLRLLLPTHYVPSIAISRLPLSPISKKWDHRQIGNSRRPFFWSVIMHSLVHNHTVYLLALA